MNQLEQLQEDVVAYCLGNPNTSVVPFTSFRKQAIESAMDDAMAAWKVRQDGKIGVACLVLLPAIRSQFPNVPGPQFSLELTLRTFEDPKVNNTGLTAEDVGLANLRWLDGLVIEDLTELYPDDRGLALRPNYDYPGFLVYDTILMGELPQEMLARTPAPDIAESGGIVTLSCADPDATIYYTTDGKAPQIGASAVWDGSGFAVEDGAIVRAVAFKPGGDLLASHVSKGRITI